MRMKHIQLERAGCAGHMSDKTTLQNLCGLTKPCVFMSMPSFLLPIARSRVFRETKVVFFWGGGDDF